VAGSVLSICQRAVLAVGIRQQLSSLNEGSPQANACATLYDPTFRSIARTARWNCLRAQATLSLLAAQTGTPENPQGTTLPQPPSPWLYSYAVPSNSLAIRFLVPSFPTPATGIPPTTASINGWPTWPAGTTQIKFQVAYATDNTGNPVEIILTNLSQAQAVYTVNQPNPAIWDSLFEQGMVAALAAFLVPALSMSSDMLKMQVAQADRIIAIARAADGNEGASSVDHTPDWMRARMGSSGSYQYIGPNAVYYAPYSDMAWPAF